MVLCVDRDDDLGRKARLQGPIIGREENLKAATQLGLVDAEDHYALQGPRPDKARKLTRILIKLS